MHEGKIESSKLQIGEAIRILEGAIATIREAQRYREDPALTMDAEQAKDQKSRSQAQAMKGAMTS